jgi:polar amino acid transport system substrate-binding protein
VKQRWLCVFCFAFVATPAIAQEKKPELRWGTDPTGGAPYIYQTPAGEFTGFEWELAHYLAEKVGRTPVMKKGEWNKLPDLLDKSTDADEAIDLVLNGYELRDDLKEKLSATVPYYAYRLVLMTQKDNDAIVDW